MQATYNVRAVRTRLLRLAEKSHDYASAWYAGYCLHVHTWHSQADRCLRMSRHFEAKAVRLARRAHRLIADPAYGRYKASA